VNGRIEVGGAATVDALLRRHGIDPGARFIAVAVNGAVVRRDLWAATPLGAHDEVEIIRPLQGG
jgi:sulfur carrier protein